MILETYDPPVMLSHEDKKICDQHQRREDYDKDRRNGHLIWKKKSRSDHIYEASASAALARVPILVLRRIWSTELPAYSDTGYSDTV